MKRFINPLFAVLLACSLLFSCGQTGIPEETAAPADTEKKTEPAENEIDRSGDYTYNPCLTGAYRVDDRTVRVKFSVPVAGQQHILVASVFACGDAAFETRIACAEAYPVNAAANDKFTFLLSDTWELVFSSALPEKPFVCITEPPEYSDGDPVMEKIFFGAFGEGLYGDSAFGNRRAAVLECSDEEIPGETDPRPRVLWADVTDPETGTARIRFSEPVTSLNGALNTHLFVSDQANPMPGAGESWQIGVTDVKAIGGQTKDGKTYAEAWEFHFAGKPDRNYGVIRISENDGGAPAEFASPSDNDDIGRVLVGISGNPVRATFTDAWDVAFAQFDMTDLIE